MKKRIASLLLALPLCLTLLPTTALAEDEAASDRTVIATVEDLQQFARAVDAGDYDGKTDAVVELAADLDLTGIEWTPIGSTVNADGEVEHCFSGKFYGNGHTVSNLDLSDVYGATGLCGFFGNIENAEISSLTVQGTINVNSEREYTYYGAIAGFAGGCTIFDCTADVSFTNNENLVYGMIGLCGQASDTVIDYCRNTGDLLLTGDAGSLYAGGIVGFADGDSEIRYCVNTGELSLAASHGGGIAGQLAGNAKVINCYATGKLTPYGKGTEDLGGIVGTAGGSAGSAAIQHCYFAGEMDMSQYTASAPYGRLGAIAGSAKDTTAFENNYYAESNEVTACGKGVAAGEARTYEAMCSEDFYNELTAGGGRYQYNTPSTPVLPAPKYLVTFVVAPADMTNVVITVNGEPVEENAELEAGTYTVTVAADNCETVNKEITITADRATHTQQLELRYLDADYSKVDAAIAKAEALNKDEYKDFTKVEEAVNAVVRGKNITEQTEVDAMAKAIEDAIAALEYKDADYSKVDAAIAKAEALNKNEYKDFTKVEEAVNAVVRGKNITEQTEVDAMAKAIEDAIAALEYKDADYSKVDAAIAKAKALNKNEYKDFTKVGETVNAVVRGKNITEQTEVDAMAKAIEDAIAALEYKDADYSKVDAAIAKAEALNKNEYKDFTKVEEAVNAVVRGKNITEQAEVDAMAKAIENAIAALERKPAKSTPTATAKPVTVSAQAEAVKETATVSSVIPQTGDNWNKELYISLFVLSGFALAGTAVLKNRKPHK